MNIIKNKLKAVKKLLDQEIVVIFTGHSEWGARALGNRSMLFDPRNPNAKEIVNKIKKDNGGDQLLQLYCMNIDMIT